MACRVGGSDIVKFAGQMGTLLHMDTGQAREKEINIVDHTLIGVGLTKLLYNNPLGFSISYNPKNSFSIWIYYPH